MKLKFYIISLFLLLIVAVTSEFYKTNSTVANFYTNAEKVFENKQNVLTEGCNELLSVYEKIGEINDNKWIQQYFEKSITYAVYKNDSLLFWNTNSLNFSELNIVYSDSLVLLSNGYYYANSVTNDSVLVTGFIRIKNAYAYENDFLKNDYVSMFKVPDYVSIVIDSLKGSPVYSNQNKYLFSYYINSDTENLYNSNLSIALFSLFFIMLFVLGYKFMLNYKGEKWRVIILYAIIFIFAKVIMLVFSVPNCFYTSELFSSNLYAYSFIIPSLGDLLISSCFVFYIAFLIHRFLNLDKSIVDRNKNRKIFSLILFLLTAVLFVFIEKIISNIITNSSVSYNLFDLLSLSVYSVVAYFVIMQVVVVFIMISGKLIQILDCKSWRVCLIAALLSALLIVVINYFISNVFIPYSIFFYWLFIFMLFFLQKEHKYTYSRFIILILLVALYIIFATSNINYQKEANDRKVLAVNLANEHDPVAELLFKDLEIELENDEKFSELLFNSTFDFNDFYDYLLKNYFNGFWNKYDIQVTICNQSDSLLIENSNEVCYCYGFFDELIQREGSAIPNSSFYYLDNQNGRITYFGKIIVKISKEIPEYAVFLQLDSKLVGAQLGYPELLLDKDVYKAENLSGYSFAKYKNNELNSQFGDYPYSLKLSVYGDNHKEFVFKQFDYYNHLVYTIDKNTSIIISRKAINFYDYLVSFSYVFVGLFILLNIFLLVLNNYYEVISFKLNLKNKIQIVILGILMFSLLIIGGVTVNYIIKQHRNSHFLNISERIQSVFVELEHKIGYESSIYDVPKDYLTSLLIKFSNVFFTDINVYSPNGRLYATSRSEIFDQGLIGKLMNPLAFKQVVKQNKAEFIHEEHIGTLKYISAYIPFTNTDNKLIAYLNLPYFTKQNILQKEVTTFIVAIINIYVLLSLFAILLAVLVSNSLTQPLYVLRQRFKNMVIGESYETIDYHSDDEIGVLVAEYNKMVLELNRNIKLLAKQERDSAWREMAKQIAHEVKNPLTPMKLNVQLLTKSWKNKDENFSDRLKKVTETLIEQIDALSGIANEFSAFAKMPKENLEAVNLVQKVKNSLNLFQQTDNLKLKLIIETKETLIIYCDKEQVLRVFNNIIKNAIQSIPKNKAGNIFVRVFKDEDFAIVEISDNGVGVDDTIKDKLFLPNFTTKTSGMGLGLAIVKNIIENMNGTVWFETDKNKGTKFFVKLPLLKS